MTPQCLVVTLTRELAIQIYDETRKFSFSTNLRAALAYGGTSTGEIETPKEHKRSVCRDLFFRSQYISEKLKLKKNQNLYLIN